MFQKLLFVIIDRLKRSGMSEDDAVMLMASLFEALADEPDKIYGHSDESSVLRS